MWCTCHQNPPCIYCENMPEEAVDLRDTINAKKREIDSLTRLLKDSSPGEFWYAKNWDTRVWLKHEVFELEKKLEEIYPDN